jgi:hypothetical protein
MEDVFGGGEAGGGKIWWRKSQDKQAVLMDF